MNVAYVNPFIVACRNVFDTMIHVPLNLGRPHLRQRSVPWCKVSSTIELSGPVEGVIALSYSEAVALALVTSLTGQRAAKIDADVLDALAEIANMVAGSAKKHLPGGLVKLSLPKAALAAEQVVFPPGMPVISIPCDTGAGRFLIEVALRQGGAVPITGSDAPQPSDAPADGAELPGNAPLSAAAASGTDFPLSAPQPPTADPATATIPSEAAA